MSPQERHSTTSDHHRRALRWLIIGAAAVLLAVAIVAALFVIKWPFTRGHITHSLESALHGSVQVRAFHDFVFPHPGCVIEGFTLTRSGKVEPLATADKLTIRAGYLELLFRPGYIDRIAIENLNVQVRRGSKTDGKNSNQGAAAQNQDAKKQESNQKKHGATRVGTIVANNSMLTVFRSDDTPPLKFQIHSLELNSVGVDEAIGYRIEMTNALPPGEISSHGRLGPWNASDPKKTPLFGTSTLEGANLAAFHGIAGSLSSKNDFAGMLDSLEVNGDIDVPDFKVKSARDSVPVRAHFRAHVDATKGDVDIERAEGDLRKTPVEARGRIASDPRNGKKVTAIDFSVHNGRIQDVIGLFTKDKPPLNGRTNFRAHTVLHAFGEKFLKETELAGEFEIFDGRFTSAQRQASVDELSARAHNQKPKGKSPEVACEFHGQVTLKKGTAHFTSLELSVPAAVAVMNGTYNLINEKVDLHGILRTQAPISKEARGIKSILLTPLDPLFKKKNAGAEVPVQMTGTYDKPQFSVILASKGKSQPKSHEKSKAGE